METKTIIVWAAIIAAVLVVSSLIVYGVTVWTGSLNVDIGDNVTSHVTDSAGVTTLTSPYTIPTITEAGTYTYTYRVYNDGNVDIQITITETNTLPAGSTATWNPASPFPVTKAQSYRTITLTVEIPDVPGTGAYGWSLDAEKAP
jgi:archaellum component FlaG (FlaF/FlaG flagellin family)